MFQTAFQPNAFQNDAFQIVINPVGPTKTGGDDAWTPEERKRYKALQKKLRIAEEKRIAAIKAETDAQAVIDTKASALAILTALGLSEDEVKALVS